MAAGRVNMGFLYAVLWRLLLAVVRLLSWLRRGRLWDPQTEQRHFLRDAKSLQKLPVHLGLVLAEEQPNYSDVASLVVWSTALGVSYVSVYDHQGDFQKNSSYLQEEIQRQQQEQLGPHGTRYSLELLSKDLQGYVSCRVKVLSPQDGKPSIVQAARKFCHSVEKKEKSSSDISVSVLDLLLREPKNIPDPELVLQFGPVNSMLGFLPWHIRLTEFISLPSHREVSYQDLLGALRKFGSCQQRLGQ